ncbi:hypothetical protein RRG08_059713 [Elysia crispata]|uniref:Uncharacterized protein n=1 Tax=Elysia crispata TaxID=231223 RepID=A0AAE0YHE6_9GAST|nr:hypothetical protein RRG08_059713 [Elysia crispata]
MRKITKIHMSSQALVMIEKNVMYTVDGGKTSEDDRAICVAQISVPQLPGRPGRIDHGYPYDNLGCID